MAQAPQGELALSHILVPSPRHLADTVWAEEGDVSRTHFEVKYFDPDGILFDLSETGWVGATRD